MGHYHMREKLLRAVLAHANGEIQKHKANVEVYLEHPAGIGEHSDITEAIQVELDKISRYHDQIAVIKEYFYSSTDKQFRNLRRQNVSLYCRLSQQP